MEKAGKRASDLDAVRDCVSKLNRNRGLIRELERKLKPFLDAKRTVARFLKEHPNHETLVDSNEEHYCFPIRHTQLRFSPDRAKELLGAMASECYERRTLVSVGFSVDGHGGDRCSREEVHDDDAM